MGDTAYRILGVRAWRRSLLVALAAVCWPPAARQRRHQRRRHTDAELVHLPRAVASFAAAAASCSAASGGEYTIQIRSCRRPPTASASSWSKRSAAKDSLDILGLDVVWEAEFAEAGWIQP